MAFNPDIMQGIQIPNFTYQPMMRGAADLGQLIGQAGGAVINTANAVDALQKQAITKAARKDYNAAAQKYGGDAVVSPDAPGGTPVADPNAMPAPSVTQPVKQVPANQGPELAYGDSAGVPAPLQDYANATQKIVDINASGGWQSPEDFHARLNASMKAAINRYPGQEEAIHAIYQRITGFDPQNALVEDTLKAAAANRSAAQKKYEDDLAIMKAGMEKGYPFDKDAYDAEGPAYFSRWQSGFNVFLAGQTNQKLMNDQIDAAKKSADWNADKAKIAGGQIATNIGNSILNSQLPELMHRMDEYNKRPTGATPQELQQLSIDIETLRTNLRQGLYSALYNQSAIGGTLSGSAQGKSAIDDIVNSQMARVDGLVEAFNSDKTGGLFKRAANRIQAEIDQREQYILSKYPRWATVAAMMKIGGTAGSDILNVMSSSWQQGMSESAKQMAEDVFLSGQIDPTTGQPSQEHNTADYIDAIKQRPPLPGETPQQLKDRNATDARDFILSAVSTMNNADMSTKEGQFLATQGAKHLFGPGAAEFDSFSPDSAMTIFKLMTSPAMQAKMMAVGQTNPDLYQKYQSWTLAAARQSMGKMIADVAKRQGDGDLGKYMKIEWNPQDMHFHWTESPEVYQTEGGTNFGIGVEDTSQNAVHPLEQQFNKDTITLLQNVNGLLDQLNNVEKVSPGGKAFNVPQAVEGMFNTLGYDKNIQPVRGTPLYKSIFDAIQAGSARMAAEREKQKIQQQGEGGQMKKFEEGLKPAETPPAPVPANPTPEPDTRSELMTPEMVPDSMLAKFAQMEGSVDYAKAKDVDPNLLTSPKGAVGIYQITAENAQHYGFNPADRSDAEMNKKMARANIADLNNIFHGNPVDMYAGYNMGIAGAKKWIAGGRQWNKLPEETRAALIRGGYGPADTGVASAEPAKTRGTQTADLSGAIPEKVVGVGGDNTIQYDNLHVTRNLPVSPALQQTLSKSADGPAAGVHVVVFSGGQKSIADIKQEGISAGLSGAKLQRYVEQHSRNERTGSDRHDNGNSADVHLVVDGRTLDYHNKNDLPIIQAYLVNAIKNGATGIGAGDGYMDSKGIHIGYGHGGQPGNYMAWGENNDLRNAPKWLLDVFKQAGVQIGQPAKYTGSGENATLKGSAGTDDLTQGSTKAPAGVQVADEGSGWWSANGDPGGGMTSKELELKSLQGMIDHIKSLGLPAEEEQRRIEAALKSGGGW